MSTFRRSRVFFLGSLFAGVLLGTLVSVGLQRALAPGGRPDATAEPRAVADRANLDPDERRTIELFRTASVSVVYITTQAQRMDFWTRNIFEVPQGTGSGFLWDDRGHVVTNYHVLQGATAAKITLADQEYEATFVGGAADHDLAVLQIRAPGAKLVPIRVGTSDVSMNNSRTVSDPRAARGDGGDRRRCGVDPERACGIGYNRRHIGVVASRRIGQSTDV